MTVLAPPLAPPRLRTTATAVPAADLARYMSDAVAQLWPLVRRQVPGLERSKARWSLDDEMIVVTGARLRGADVNIPEELAEAVLAPYLGEVTVHVQQRNQGK